MQVHPNAQYLISELVRIKTCNLADAKPDKTSLPLHHIAPSLALLSPS